MAFLHWNQDALPEPRESKAIERLETESQPDIIGSSLYFAFEG